MSKEATWQCESRFSVAVRVEKCGDGRNFEVLLENDGFVLNVMVS
ncbi:unnamed protein product [Lathyrus oleraceus]